MKFIINVYKEELIKYFEINIELHICLLLLKKENIKYEFALQDVGFLVEKTGKVQEFLIEISEGKDKVVYLKSFHSLYDFLNRKGLFYY